MSSDKEFLKLPLYYADPTKDAFPIENWIRRVENLQKSYNWTDAITASHAGNALRDRAITFLDYLEGIGVDINLWPNLKANLLKRFGTTDPDQTLLTNLHLIQKHGESAMFFGYRVGQVVDKLFQTFLEDVSDVQSIIDSATALVPYTATQKDTLEKDKELNSNLGMNFNLCVTGGKKSERVRNKEKLKSIIFLNGLRKEIRKDTKLRKMELIDDLITIATEVEKAQDLFSDNKGLAINEVEQQEVNAFGKKPYPKNKVFKRKTPLECWYCHKKNHTQKNCRLRLARGASMVSKPRSVQEIQVDYMSYQDEGEYDTSEDEEPQDNKTEGEHEGYEAAANSIYLN